MNANEIILNRRENEIEWLNDRCDKYDYMIAAFCGFAAGIIDSVFVGIPGQSKLGEVTDKGADFLVSKIANMLWEGDGRSYLDGKPRMAPDTLQKSISYLEQGFPVNYDARYAPDLLNVNGALGTMTPKNHHLLSLAHSPDIIGLLFSILDQFTGRASFIYSGKLIRLYPVKDARNNKIMYMQGTNFESKLFCGICNWLGHLASDLCGSSSTRQVRRTGRGMGIPMPFYELFLLMDFGNFDGHTFAEIAIKVFEDGYDLRHGVAMAIPVFITELSIKIIWMMKKHFYNKKDWRDCIPNKKYADLRMMILIGDTTLCIVDSIDATIRAVATGGNLINFILHMNFIAWSRIIMLVFRELKIRYGVVVEQGVRKYLSELGLNDRYALKQYYDRMNAIDQNISYLLKDFIMSVEKEYKEFVNYANRSLNNTYGTAEDRRIASIEFAERQGVSANRIVRTQEELKAWFDEGKNKKQ